MVATLLDVLCDGCARDNATDHAEHASRVAPAPPGRGAVDAPGGCDYLEPQYM